MKKFLRYAVLLIVVYLVVEVFVYFITKPYYKDMDNYEVFVKNPTIEVTESKAAKRQGYIQGTVTNNTEEIISNIKVRFDFYNEEGIYLGTNYKTIETLNVTEKINFDIQYVYLKVAEINISIIK